MKELLPVPAMLLPPLLSNLVAAGNWFKGWRFRFAITVLYKAVYMRLQGFWGLPVHIDVKKLCSCSICLCMHAWMHEWMDGWLDGRRDGWMFVCLLVQKAGGGRGDRWIGDR